MEDVSRAIQLFLTEQWMAGAAVAIFVVVRVLKSPVMPWPIFLIPPKARTLVAVLLGFVGAGLQSITVGVTWQQAVAENLIACLGAILAHDVVIEWLREGREIGEPKRKVLPPR